jgi:hypothetical protein
MSENQEVINPIELSGEKENQEVIDPIELSGEKENQEVIDPIELSEEKEILIHKGPYFSLTMNSKFSEIKKQPFLPKRKSSRIKKPVCK